MNELVKKNVRGCQLKLAVINLSVLGHRKKWFVFFFNKVSLDWLDLIETYSVTTARKKIK